MKGYQLKINVKKSSKPLWRRVIVPGIYDFTNLHTVIQIIFQLDDCHWFDFLIRKKRLIVCSDGIGVKYEFNDYFLIPGHESIDGYFEEGLTIQYSYNYDDNWGFTIKVEKELDDVKKFAQVVKYRGLNLIDDCGGIETYEVIKEDEIDWLTFDINAVNNRLMTIEASYFLKDTKKSDEFNDLLPKIPDLIEKRRFNHFQLIKLVGHQTTYWTLLKTDQGYIVQLFEEYHDLMDSFYYTDFSVDTVFSHGYIIIYQNDIESTYYSLSDDDKTLLFKVVPGYVMQPLKEEDGTWLQACLTDLIVALENDTNYEIGDNEMLEIKVHDQQYLESNIIYHKVEPGYHRYNFQSKYGDEIKHEKEFDERVCIDVVTLPNYHNYYDTRLDIYGVITCDDYYLVQEIDDASVKTIFYVLKGMIEDFSLGCGKPLKISLFNHNLIYLLSNYLQKNDIEIVHEEIQSDIDSALINYFGLEDDFFDFIRTANYERLFDQSDEDDVILDDIDDLLN